MFMMIRLRSWEEIAPHELSQIVVLKCAIIGNIWTFEEYIKNSDYATIFHLFLTNKRSGNWTSIPAKNDSNIFFKHMGAE